MNKSNKIELYFGKTPGWMIDIVSAIRKGKKDITIFIDMDYADEVSTMIGKYIQAFTKCRVLIITEKHPRSYDNTLVITKRNCALAIKGVVADVIIYATQDIEGCNKVMVDHTINQSLIGVKINLLSALAENLKSLKKKIAEEK